MTNTNTANPKMIKNDFGDLKSQLKKRTIFLTSILKKHWNGNKKDLFECVFAQRGKIFRHVKNRKTLSFSVDNKLFFLKLHGFLGWREIFKNLLYGKAPIIGARSECDAILRLRSLGIPVANIAGYGVKGWNPARQRSFIVMEALEDTISLEDFCRDWPSSCPSLKLKRAIIREVARIARMMHSNGVNHRDLYICHFLLDLKNSDLDTGYIRLYVLDLHRAQIRKKTPMRWVVKDLAALYFSSLEIGLTARDYYTFLKVYCDKGNLTSIFSSQKNVFYAVKNRALKLFIKEKFSKKMALLLSWKYLIHDNFLPLSRLLSFVKRPRKEIFSQKIRYKKMLVFKDRSEDVAFIDYFLENRESFFLDQTIVPLKADRTSTVIKISYNERYYVIKRYNYRSFFYNLKRAISVSRAEKSWKSACLLSELGIPTAKPIGVFVEKHFFLFNGRSYFISEYLEEQSLSNFFTVSQPPDLMDAVVSNVKDLFSLLDEMHISHGDCKATNIILVGETPYFIDLDRTRAHSLRYFWRKESARDRRRFLKNWANNQSALRYFL